MKSKKNNMEKRELSSLTVLKKKKKKVNLDKLSNSDNYFKRNKDMKNKRCNSDVIVLDGTNNNNYNSVHFNKNSTYEKKCIEKENIYTKCNSLHKLFFSYSLNSEKSDNISIMHVDSLDDIKAPIKNPISSNNLHYINNTNYLEHKKINETNDIIHGVKNENKKKEKKHYHEEKTNKIDNVNISFEKKYYNKDVNCDDTYMRNNTNNIVSDKTNYEKEIKIVNESDNGDDNFIKITDNFKSTNYHCDENNVENYHENNNKDNNGSNSNNENNSLNLNISYNFNEHKKDGTKMENSLFSTNLNEVNNNFNELKGKNNDNINSGDNFKIDFVYFSSSTSDTISENEIEEITINRNTLLKNKNEAISKKNNNDDFHINYSTIKKNNLINKNMNNWFSDNDLKKSSRKLANIKSDSIKNTKVNREKMKKNSNSSNEKSKRKKKFVKEMKNKNAIQKNTQQEKQRKMSNNKNNYVVNSRHVKYYPLEKLSSMKAFLNEISEKNNKKEIKNNFSSSLNVEDTILSNAFNKSEYNENNMEKNENEFKGSEFNKNHTQKNENEFKESEYNENNIEENENEFYENNEDFNINEEKCVNEINYELPNFKRFLNNINKYKRSNSCHNISYSNKVHINKLNSSMNDIYDMNDKYFIELEGSEKKRSDNNNNLNKNIIKHMKIKYVENTDIYNNMHEHKKSSINLDAANKINNTNENEIKINKNSIITDINKINEELKCTYSKDSKVNLRSNSYRNSIYRTESNNRNNLLLNQENENPLIKHKEDLTIDRKSHIDKIEQLLQNFRGTMKNFENKEKNVNTKKNGCDNRVLESSIIIKEEDEKDYSQKNKDTFTYSEHDSKNNEVINYEDDKSIFSNEINNYEDKNNAGIEILNCKSLDEINQKNVEEIDSSHKLITEKNKVTIYLNDNKYVKHNENMESNESQLLFSEDEKVEQIHILNCLKYSINLLKNENIILKNENDDLKNENIILRNESDDLKNENIILKNEISKLKNEIDNLKNENEDLSLSIINKDKKFNVDEENYKMKIEMLKCEIENINNEKIKLLESSEIAENEFLESEKKLKNIKYNNEKYIEEIETLKNEKHVIEQENENLKKNSEKIERDYKLLINDKENLKTEKMSNILKINYLEEQIKKQKIHSKDLEKELKSKEKQLLIKEEEIINQKYLVDQGNNEIKILENKLKMHEMQREEIISKIKEEKKVEVERMKRIINNREKELDQIKENEIILKKEIEIHEENMNINKNKMKNIQEELKASKDEIQELKEQVKQLKEENQLFINNTELIKKENSHLRNEISSFDKNFGILRDEKRQKETSNVLEKIKNKKNDSIDSSSIINITDDEEENNDAILQINKEIINNLFKENKKINSLNNSCLKFFHNKKDLFINDEKNNPNKLFYKNYDKICNEINNLELSELQIKCKDLLKEYIFLELIIIEYEKSNVCLHKKNKELNKKIVELKYLIDNELNNKEEELFNKKMFSTEYKNLKKEELDEPLKIYESNMNIKKIGKKINSYKNMCIELEKSNKKLFDKLEQINKLLIGEKEKDSIYEQISKKTLEIIKNIDTINEEISTFKEKKNVNDIDYSNILICLNNISVDILFINTNICSIKEFINENLIYLDIHNFKNSLFDFSFYVMSETNSCKEDTINKYVTNKKENTTECFNENKIEEKFKFINNNRNENNSKKIEFKLSDFNSANLNFREKDVTEKEENNFNFVEDFVIFFEICFSSDLFLILIHLCRGINEINGYIRKNEIANCGTIITTLQNTINEIINFYSHEGNTFFLDSFIYLFDALKNYLNRIQYIIQYEKINKMHKITYEVYNIKKVIRYIIFSFFNFHIDTFFNKNKNYMDIISHSSRYYNIENKNKDDNKNLFSELYNIKNNDQIEENKSIKESVHNYNSLININNLSECIYTQSSCNMNTYSSNYFNGLSDSIDFVYNKKKSHNWMNLESSSFNYNNENKDIHKIVNNILEFNYNSHIIPQIISNYMDETIILQIKEKGNRDTLTEKENYASRLFKKIYENMKLNNLIINSNNFLEYLGDELLKKKLYHNFFFKKNHFINIDIIHKYLNIIFKLNIGIDYEYFYQHFLIIINKIILHQSLTDTYNSCDNSHLISSKAENNTLNKTASLNKSVLLSINSLNRSNQNKNTNKNSISDNSDNLNYPLMDIDNKFMSILFHMWQRIEINYFSKLNSNSIYDTKLNNNLWISYNLKNSETYKLKTSDIRNYRSEILPKKKNSNIYKKNCQLENNNMHKETVYLNSPLYKSNALKDIKESDNLMETYLKLMVFDIFRCKSEEKIIGIDDFIFIFKQLHISIKTSVIYAIWCIIVGSKDVNSALKEKIPVSLFIKKAYTTNPSLIFYEYCKTKIQLKEAKKNIKLLQKYNKKILLLVKN